MEVGYNRASWDTCSFSALGMFPNRGCFPFHFPGQQMQWHQGHILDVGGPVAMGTTSSRLLRGSSARWPVQDLAIAKCRWGGDCCKAQTSFFWRRPPCFAFPRAPDGSTRSSGPILPAPLLGRRARVFLQRGPSQASFPGAPGSNARPRPREGHHSHSLGTSSAFWPWPPLPGEGAAAGAAAGAELEAAVCVSSSHLLWGSSAAVGAAVGVGAGAGGEEAAVGAGAAPPGPCGWPLRWWPWWYLGWRRAPAPAGSGWASGPFCWAGRCIFPAPAFGLWSPHRIGWAAFGDAPSFSWRSCCLSLIVSAAAWPSGSCSRGPGSSWWTGSWCSCTSSAPRTGWPRSPASWIVSSGRSWLQEGREKKLSTGCQLS